MNINTDEKVEPVKIILAFLAVYIIWGSTYIAIKYALESFSPFLMSAIRFAIGGTLMCAWSYFRQGARPRLSDLRSTAVLGFLLLVMGSTGVVLAEKTVPSGVVSLLVTSIPCFIVLLEWLKPGGCPPGKRVIVGLVLGTLGILLLVGAHMGGHFASIDLVGVGYVLLGAFGSANGALYSRSAKVPRCQNLSAGLQMAFASFFLFILAIIFGECSLIPAMHFSLRSMLALLYLTVFGSMIAFSAYLWLLRHVPASRVATYAYVNPVVAVILGCCLGGEVIGSETMLGAGVLLLSVWLINSGKSQTKLVKTPSEVREPV